MKMPMWWLRLWSHVAPRKTVRFCQGDEVLCEIGGRELVVAREDQLDWEAAMRCPCGCGDKLELELVPEAKPRWNLTLDHHRRPTLHPSIHRVDRCKAHFFVRKGKIIWC